MQTPGERIAEARKRAGTSQKDLAVLVDKTQQTITNWETGRSAPSLDDLATISRALGVSIDWVVTGEDSTGGESLTADEKLLIRYYRRASATAKIDISTTAADLSDVFRHEGD